jgi:hypothetical protein
MGVLKKNKCFQVAAISFLEPSLSFVTFLSVWGNIYILGFVHIIVKVEDTLAQLTVWFFTLDNYMLFSVNEKVKIIYIY